VAARFAREAPALLRELDVKSAWEAALAAELGSRRRLASEQLGAAAHAMADFADLKEARVIAGCGWS
jgi:hypothetical protein